LSQPSLLSDLPLALLDANVLVQASVRDTLLRLAEYAAYRPLWSIDIINEVKRTLESKLGIAAERTVWLETQLREHFPEAWVEDYAHLIPLMQNDRKDRHVLAAAVHAKATVVVTYNLRDFPVHSTMPWRLTAVGPSRLLKSLYRDQPALMLDVLENQATDIGRTLHEQLRVLHQAVPRFVQEVCQKEGIVL